MRELIDKKFEGISHKWLSIPLDSPEFDTIKHAIIDETNNSEVFSKHNAKLLTDVFKEKGFAWIKFLRVKGRKTQKAICQIITKDNFKIQIDLSCKSILELPLLEGTPKSLKLYKPGEKVKQNHNWKKPNDGFYDTFEIPLDEEFTETGYILYKEFHEELKSKGLTLEEWHALKGGPRWTR